MTYAAINLKELKHYESFNTVIEMDKSIYEYIDHIKSNVSKSVIDVLLCLGRSSLRCVGLSFMKQATIAEQTGYSRKTVNKALKKLEALGIVDSVRTKTKKGRPSVKVMRILPFCLERLQQGVTSSEGDEVNEDNGLTLVSEFEPFVTNHQKHLKEDRQDSTQNKSLHELDYSFTPKAIVDSEFIAIAKPFFNAAKIFKLWGVVKNAMKRKKVDMVTAGTMEAIKEAFKTTIFMEKSNRITSTFDNYFFSVLSSMFATVKRRELAVNAENNILFYNWLDE